MFEDAFDGEVDWITSGDFCGGACPMVVVYHGVERARKAGGVQAGEEADEVE